MLAGQHGDLCGVTGAEFPLESHLVGAHRLHTHVELTGNVGDSLAACEQPQHLEFAGGEGGSIALHHDGRQRREVLTAIGDTCDGRADLVGRGALRQETRRPALCTRGRVRVLRVDGQHEESDAWPPFAQCVHSLEATDPRQRQVEGADIDPIEIEIERGLDGVGLADHVEILAMAHDAGQSFAHQWVIVDDDDGHRADRGTEDRHVHSVARSRMIEPTWHDEVMPDIDVEDLGAVLGELDAGWWRVDLRGDRVNSSPNVAALLGFPDDHALTPDEMRTHRPWPGGVWRKYECTYASSGGVLRSHLVAVRDEHDELTAVFGLETREHGVELPVPLATHSGTVSDVDADAQLLQDILSIQPAMVVRYRADGRVEWCNEAYAAHFLRAPSEVIGFSWVDLGVEYGHDSREGLEGTLASVVEYASVSPATVVAPLIGSVATRWFQWTNRCLPPRADGEVLFQGIGVEVTELRAARDALDAMAHELARGRLSERRELARRLHDDAIQVLVSAMWAVAPSDGRDVSAADAERGAELIREAIDHLRACLGDLTSPPVLPGLLIDHIAADVEAVRAAGAEVHLYVDDVPREEIRTVAARVIAEGLRNVVRHAGAQRVDVRLEVQGNVVTGIVVDDGVGADVDDVSRALAAGHVGLLMSRALVESIGGTFTLGRNRPRGTVLEFELPLLR